MKRLLLRQRPVQSSGFTLVELLVVIAIIAILAAVTLNIGSTVIKAAKRAKAANTASQIQTASLAYYTEYSVYPLPASTTTDYLITDASGSAANWKGLIYGLCGNINPYDSSTTVPTSGLVANSRAIAFLSMKNSDVDANGGPLNPLPPSATNPYFNIMEDADYNNIIGDSATTLCPNFSKMVQGTAPMPYNANQGPTGGIAVWANCNGNATLQNPNFWVHTY